MDSSVPEVRRTEIATFDGINVEVDEADCYVPQIHVTFEGNLYRIALLGEGLPGETPIAPASVRARIEAWFDLRVPAEGRLVADLVYDQWLRARNRRPAEAVPSPKQIMGPSSSPARPFFVGDYYAIANITVLPNFHLRVAFLNGETRIADIKRMRGDHGFEQVFANFGSAENRIHHVEWPVMFPDGPNTLEIENQDLWGAGILVASRP